MPSKSEKQRKLFALALSYKKGDTKDVNDNIKKIADKMSKKELEKYASSVKTEATTSASSGSFETPLGVSAKDMKKLEDLKEDKMDITLEQFTNLVKRTLIREEVFSEKPSNKTTTAFNQTGESKGKDVSNKNAKKQKTYDSNAGKATSNSTKKDGKNSKSSVSDSISKVEKNQKNNLKNASVVDVNKNKVQNDNMRREAHQNGMEDTTFDNISKEQQKKNQEYLKNEKALKDPNAQDSKVAEQMIDDAKKRKETKDSSKFRKARVYGSDVEHIEDIENKQKNLAYEGAMKKLTYKKPFKGVNDAIRRIPEKYKINNKVFEMHDGVNRIRVRWEGAKHDGLGVILEHRNIKEEKLLHERMNTLIKYNREQYTSSKTNEKDFFKKMFKESKDLSKG